MTAAFYRLAPTLILGLMAAIMPLAAQASCGAYTFNMVIDGMRGNLGVILGFLVSFGSMLVFVIYGKKIAVWGIIAGAALTAFPGLFISAMQSGVLLLTNTGAIEPGRFTLGASGDCINTMWADEGTPEFSTTYTGTRTPSSVIPGGGSLPPGSLGQGMGWQAPLGGDPLTMTSNFGNRTAPCTGCSRYHRGIDLRVAGSGGPPTNVTSVSGGTVIYSDTMIGYGNTVIVDHGNGYLTRYSHLGNLTDAGVGTTVAAGQRLGQIGGTAGWSGSGTAAHLDFGVLESPGGGMPANFRDAHIDPVAFLGEMNCKTGIENRNGCL